MNNRAVTLSIAMAVLAVLLVQSYVSTVEESAERRFGTERLVIVAKENIAEMQTLEESQIELKAVPEAFVQPAAISFPRDPNSSATKNFTKGIIGRIALVPIRKGEQVSFNKITEPNIRTGLAPRITPGMRAVSIPVNEVTGVSKLVKPGDRVDIIAILKDIRLGSTSSQAKTILQDISVLAVGRFVSGNLPRLVESSGGRSTGRVRNLTTYDGFVSVTVEVRPNEAQMLGLLVMDRETKLILALRNADDSNKVPAGSVSTQDFVDSSPRAPAAESGKSVRNPGTRVR